MADHFSTAFGGAHVPPWASALTGPDLAPWVDQVLDEHPRQSYSVEAWMFGTTPEIPRWTGYSAGYAIAGEYLALTGRAPGPAAGDRADDIIDRVRASR
jgi:uncharacterized protein YjaZ